MVTKILLFILAIVAVTAGIYFATKKFGSFVPSSKASTTTTILTLTSPSLKLKPGDSQTIGITLNSQINSVSAVELTLNFDPNIIAIDSITPSTFFPTVLMLTPLKISGGKATIIFGNTPSVSAKGISGSGILANIKFHTIGLGTFNLTTTGSRVASINKTSNTYEDGGDSLIIVSTPTLTPTPTPTTTPPLTGGKAVIGYLDVASCSQIYGWSSDQDNPNVSSQVDIYADGSVGQGKLITTLTANSPRESAVCQIPGGTNCSVCPSNNPQCLHGFVLSTPSSLKDGRTHQIYAIGKNLPLTLGVDTPLTGNPKSITCP